MHLRLFVIGSLLVGCPSGSDSGGSTGESATGTTGVDVPMTGSTGVDEPTTGEAPVMCVAGGIGDAFTWATAPTPGVAECTLITDSSLAFDCDGDFTGIYTIELVNTGEIGLVAGDGVEIDYRQTKEGELITGEWVRVRGQNQWYIVAGQGPTLAPPGAPADWFHPNVEVAVLTGCAAVACDDGSGDESAPRSISFGQGENVQVLGPGKSGAVPGEFGGERYQAAVSEAHTGVCGGGPASAGLDVLAFSVVSSGLL